MSGGMKLLFDGNRGIYIPKHFAEEIYHMYFTGYTQEDLDILLGGPDTRNELYWEVWTSILDNAEHIDENGYTWRLHQDGDVWLYCDDLMDEDEREIFLGCYC